MSTASLVVGFDGHTLMPQLWNTPLSRPGRGRPSYAAPAGRRWRPGPARPLAAAVAAGRERGKIVGAGTVITPEQVQAARDAGAGYTVAPGLAPRILSASIATGLPHLPGVATPSEVQHAQQLGCQWVKVFPASTLGPGWFQAIRGPFPNMRYVATGGISAAQAPDYLEAGADLIALGSAILNPDRTTR